MIHAILVCLTHQLYRVTGKLQENSPLGTGNALQTLFFTFYKITPILHLHHSQKGAIHGLRYPFSKNRHRRTHNR